MALSFVVAFATILVVLLMEAAPSQTRGVRGRYYGYNSAPYFSPVYEIRDLKARVEKLEKQGCESGYINAFICDENNWLPVCNYLALFTGNNIQATIDVPLQRYFDEGSTPVVTAGLAGINDLGPKNCTVETRNVNSESFTLELTLGGVLPFSLRLFYMACDAAALH